MNQQQKKWEKEQKRRQAKKERAGEAAAHVEKGEPTGPSAPIKARDAALPGNSPVKAPKHQVPVKTVHKQGAQRGT